MKSDLEVIRVGLKEAQRLLRDELAAMLKCMTEVPSKFAIKVVEEMAAYNESLATIELGLERTDEVLAEWKIEQQKFDRNLRLQKKWRIIACKACLGHTRDDELVGEAFRDLITDPPSHEKLDAQLAELADRMEASQQATEQFGALRNIVLDDVKK